MFAIAKFGLLLCLVSLEKTMFVSHVCDSKNIYSSDVLYS